MLAILSPAKTLDFETPSITDDFSTPEYLDDSAKLIDQLREYSPEQISELMGISSKLGTLNSNRYLSWQLPFTPENSKQAVLAFKGDVYTGLEADQMSPGDLKWAQSHLRILSGLYGVLKPLDLIQPYRLEMGIKLSNPRGKDLYQFWGNQLTDALNSDLGNQSNPTLINLASNEYFKSIDQTLIQAPIITPVFKDWKNGKYKIISFFAKKARGWMTAHMIRERLNNPEGLKAFTTGGYAYSANDSNDGEWVFLRNQGN